MSCNGLTDRGEHDRYMNSLSLLCFVKRHGTGELNELSQSMGKMTGRFRGGCIAGLRVGGEGAKVTKRSTHARSGMHMQILQKKFCKRNFAKEISVKNLWQNFVKKFVKGPTQSAKAIRLLWYNLYLLGFTLPRLTCFVNRGTVCMEQYRKAHFNL